ncbi:MAG: phosphate signaling complex protein PhoU [Chloroflexi bacterium]|nr:phosphate signaling complex protein PhoU [Chloroflexota bacterium]
MTRLYFEQEMLRLQEQVLLYGNTVENALRDAVALLMTLDQAGTEDIMERYREIVATHGRIEDDTLALIATQQPMATDLRLLAAILEISSELERIGDYARGIARITQLLGDNPKVPAPQAIIPMVTQARDMMLRALQCFIHNDAQNARLIPREDDAVDTLFRQVERELMNHIIADPTCIEHANYYLWAAHNLERSADRVTNICERIVFTVSGEMRELETTMRKPGISGI